MTPTHIQAQVDEAQRHITVALAKVYALCDGREKWTMSVPVRPEHDHDFVIANALGMASQTIFALREALGREQQGRRALLEQVLEALNNITDYEGLSKARHALRSALEQPQQELKPARPEDMAVYQAIADNYWAGQEQPQQRTAADAGYTDIVSDGGMDPRNANDWGATTEQLTKAQQEEEWSLYRSMYLRVRDECALAQQQSSRLQTELQEQARLNGMGAERELNLMAKVQRDEALMRQCLEAFETDDWSRKMQSSRLLRERLGAAA